MANLRTIKRKVQIMLGEAGRGDRSTARFDLAIEILVLLNVGAVILESFEPIETRFHLAFVIFEIITVSLFSLEFIARLWIADVAYPTDSHFKSILKYLTRFHALIDIIAIAPFFVPYFLNMDLRHLRVLRLARLLRVFKLEKYLDSLRLISKIMTEKRKELLATLLLMFSVLVISSSLMFYAEKDFQPGQFSNILQAFWWGISTLTTIGYGDIVPITPVGKIIGSVVALIGVMIVAIPTGIISSSFVQKMDETNYKKRMNLIRKKLREAYYKRYVPEMGIRLRRSQISVEAIKMELEMAEQDIYKIAEGKNEFRFRSKPQYTNGVVTNKLYLEFREVNTAYGTHTKRDSSLVLVSPQSLNKPSIGYFAYCIAEKVKASFVSNEFFEEEEPATEESFGNIGLEPENVFSFSHNKAYLQIVDYAIPDAFVEWMEHLEKLATPQRIFIVFDTHERASAPSGGLGALHLTYIKRRHAATGEEEYLMHDVETIKKFIHAVQIKSKEKFGNELSVTQNTAIHSVKSHNILQYVHEKLQSNVFLLSMDLEWISGEKLFKTASIVSEALKEEIMGVTESNIVFLKTPNRQTTPD